MYKPLRLCHSRNDVHAALEATVLRFTAELKGQQGCSRKGIVSDWQETRLGALFEEMPWTGFKNQKEKGSEELKDCLFVKVPLLKMHKKNVPSPEKKTLK